MLDKLNIVKQRFDEISDLIIQPDIIADQKLERSGRNYS